MSLDDWVRPVVMTGTALGATCVLIVGGGTIMQEILPPPTGSTIHSDSAKKSESSDDGTISLIGTVTQAATVDNKRVYEIETIGGQRAYVASDTGALSIGERVAVAAGPKSIKVRNPFYSQVLPPQEIKIMGSYMLTPNK